MKTKKDRPKKKKCREKREGPELHFSIVSHNSPPEKVNQSTLKDRNPFSDPGEVFIAGGAIKREGCWELRGI